MKIYTKQEWYTPAEVAIHNISTDCWVSLNGKVLNMTAWLAQQFRVCKCMKSCTCDVKSWYCGVDCVETCPCFKRGFPYCDGKRLAMTMLAFAGKDISHWFNGADWVQYTHPITGSTVPYMRFGPGHHQPVVPSTKWRPVEQPPWWLDDSIVVGKVTSKTRPIRITNAITGGTVTLEVCSEESLHQILLRYLPHNPHAMSYSWRYLGRKLVWDKTLEENGIPDERELFSDVALPDNVYIPAILIYYNDDLTIDPPKDDCHCNQQECLP